MTADGRTAVSGSYDKTVRVWDLAEGRSTAVLKNHCGWIRSVAVTADGLTAVSARHDNTVWVWSLDPLPGGVRATQWHDQRRQPRTQLFHGSVSSEELSPLRR